MGIMYKRAGVRGSGGGAGGQVKGGPSLPLKHRQWCSAECALSR